MTDPVLHLLAGPNGAGKSTLWARVLEPVLHLEFVNADEIARQAWPDDAEARSYDAALLATERRASLLAERRSFATETVFSHTSKVELVEDATAAGYLVTLHVVLVPPDLAVARVEDRVENGGHAVPEAKVRQRHDRLWAHVATAIASAERAVLYDNTSAAAPFRPIGELERGVVLWADPPVWFPQELADLVGTDPTS
jgi:predicted ABC-type ATPase